MSVRFAGMLLRPIGFALIAPLLWLGTPSEAAAQVTVNLTTTSQATCTVTTDSQGIRLAPNGTNLIATGVTLTGTGCGTGGGGGGNNPPTPNPLVLTPSPSSGTAGSTFQIAFAVNNADSCLATATAGGVTTSVPGWTDANGTSSPRTFTLATSGTYQFGLTCSNSFGSTSGTTTIVVTDSGGGGCPAGRQTSASVCYDGPLHQCLQRDVTKYENLLGHQTQTDPPELFPGWNGLSVTMTDVAKTSYIAAQFVMPTTISTQEYGRIGKGETWGTNPVTASISPNCGDFDNVPNPTQCLKVGTLGSSLNLVQWKNPANTSVAAGCPLVPGQTYYLNLKFTQPLQSTGSSDCNPTTCRLPLTNTIVTP